MRRCKLSFCAERGVSTEILPFGDPGPSGLPMPSKFTHPRCINRGRAGIALASSCGLARSEHRPRPETEENAMRFAAPLAMTIAATSLPHLLWPKASRRSEVHHVPDKEHCGERRQLEGSHDARHCGEGAGLVDTLASAGPSRCSLPPTQRLRSSRRYSRDMVQRRARQPHLRATYTWFGRYTPRTS
jgi:hypothetical protein